MKLNEKKWCLGVFDAVFASALSGGSSLRAGL